MRKLFCIALMGFVMVVNAQSPINRIEYFFNNDPGAGNGITVNHTAATDITDLIFSADISSLPAGQNHLYIRSRNANGQWSLTANSLVYKIVPVSSAIAAINYIEHFTDTDPGFGNAIPVVFNPADSVTNFSFPVDMSGISPGIHFLYVRSRDLTGKWSQTATSLLYKPLPVLNLPLSPITQIEYFVDTDPGIGNAVPLVFNAIANIDSFSYVANIAGLSAGRHFLYARSRDSSGKWSITAIDTINITTPAAPQAIVVNSLLVNAPDAPIAGRNNATTPILCAGANVRLAFDPSGTYTPGNIFTVQLSNENGAFTFPFNIGQVTGVQGVATTCKLPRHLTPGTGYKIRVVSNTPAITGDPSLDELAINDINLGLDTTVYLLCPGETTNLLPLYNTAGLTATWNAGNPSTVLPGTYSLIANNAANCPDTAFAIVKLETATWLGTISSDWHNPGNWNIGKVPTDKTHVIITGTTPNPCIISTGNAQAASIQVRNGGTVNAINNRLAEVSGKCLTLPAN